MSPVVMIRYWAGAKAAAGVASETVHAASVGDALADALARRPGDVTFARVLTISSVLVDGVVLGRERLADPIDRDVVAEILPPYAGGSQSVILHLRK